MWGALPPLTPTDNVDTALQIKVFPLVYFQRWEAFVVIESTKSLPSR